MCTTTPSRLIARFTPDIALIVSHWIKSNHSFENCTPLPPRQQRYQPQQWTKERVWRKWTINGRCAQVISTSGVSNHWSIKLPPRVIFQRGSVVLPFLKKLLKLLKRSLTVRGQRGYGNRANWIPRIGKNAYGTRVNGKITSFMKMSRGH